MRAPCRECDCVRTNAYLNESNPETICRCRRKTRHSTTNRRRRRSFERATDNTHGRGAARTACEITPCGAKRSFGSPRVTRRTSGMGEWGGYHVIIVPNSSWGVFFIAIACDVPDSRLKTSVCTTAVIKTSLNNVDHDAYYSVTANTNPSVVHSKNGKNTETKTKSRTSTEPMK